MNFIKDLIMSTVAELIVLALICFTPTNSQQIPLLYMILGYFAWWSFSYKLVKHIQIERYGFWVKQ